MRRIRFVLFLHVISLLSFSQQLHVESYTPANGLLDARVIKIFQDHRGLLYFLTWEGISIFDGQRFENISEYNGESLGLVNDMIQWKNDTCFVFTFQKGVYKLVHNRFIKDTAFNKITEPNQVLQYRDSNYIITSNFGLYKWNGKTVEPLRAELTGAQKKSVEFAAIASHLLIYIDNAGKNLNLFNLSTNKTIASITGKEFLNLKQDVSGAIFVQTAKGWLQLDDEGLKNGKLTLSALYFSRHLPAGFFINALHVAGNKIWLEDYRRGYLLLDPVTGEKETYPGYAEIKHHASLIFNDRENNYWFVQFPKQLQKTYYTKLKKMYLNAVAAVNGLLIDEDGNSIAQSGSQVYLLQEEKPVARTAGLPGYNPFYWQGRCWIFKTPFFIQSNKGEIIDLRKTANTDSTALPSSRISFDNAGRLVIGGNWLIIVEKNLEVHSVSLPYFTDNIVTDDKNNYWAFSRGGPIASYTLKNNAILQRGTVIHINPIDPRYAIHWNADTFVIGTRHHGILWFKISNGKATETGRLNTSKGLSNNLVSSLLKKNNQQLYAATGYGLDEIILNGADTIAQNLSAANNLYVTFSHVIRNNKEEIIAYSNDNQLWRVTERKNQATGFIPAVWLNEITVNGKAIDESINSFKYSENNFRFNVTAPCFTNASNLRFHFLLQNENNSWQQLSAENHYSINNLSPGKYTLTTTVFYPGKIYPDKKIEYTFVINTPFWKRLWFIFLILLFTGAIIWTVIRTYYQRKLAAQKAEADKQQAIEKERNRISHDMHDDLGSGLTKIAILSEVAKKQLSEPDKAKEQLEKISLSSRELVDNLQDIIWVLNPVNDTLESLAAYIREYALKYFEPFEIKINFNYPEHFSVRHLSEEKRRNVFLTVKESLHNIAKHAWCNEATISINEAGQFFNIRIQDDGKGFETEKIRQFANGLKNMQNRIEQTGGEYGISSAPDKGTVTIIRMPV